MSETKPPRVPPRWFVNVAWRFHRAYYRVTGGRRGLWKPRPGKWGAMRLTTIGRKSGAERVAILGYFEDGENLVTLAMNGWGEGAPAWWLNLQANPDASVETRDGVLPIHGRVAEGAEHDRLWAMWGDYGDDDIDAYAEARSTETPVVVLEPRAS